MTTDTIRLAERMRHIGMSPTMKGTIEAERLRRQGVDVVDLGAGEPDFPTPAHVTAAGARRARQAVHEVHREHGHHRAARGRRRTLPRRLRRRRTRPTKSSSPPAASRRCITRRWRCSARATRSITHAPGWPTIVEQIKLAGATPVVVRTRAGRRLRADGASCCSSRRDAAHARHRPQLARQSDRRADVRGRSADARAPRRRGAASWVVIDLCYERLIYDDVPHNLPKIFGDAMRDRLVLWRDRRRRPTR